VNSVRKIEIEVPEELFLNLKQSDEEFKKELKLLMAIDLYKKSRLSLGKAAELSGFSKLGFIDMLNFRGEPVFDYSEDEITRELKNIKSLDILKGDGNEGHM
jgi:predicted HTH domain antitoxin